jgi:hypothetical protein
MYEAEYDGVNNYRENRTLLNKHGVKLDLVQSGYLGKFSFSQLLVSLTTSLTLLAMATLVTDYVALYLLPDKEKYDEAKYVRAKRAHSCAAERTCGACAAEHMCGRAHVRPSTCAAEHMCGLAHAQPSTRATSLAARGVRGVSPRQPRDPLLPQEERA